MGRVLAVHGNRFGSGESEREASITRQMAFESLPESVLLGGVGSFRGTGVKVFRDV